LIKKLLRFTFGIKRVLGDANCHFKKISPKDELSTTNYADKRIELVQRITRINELTKYNELRG